MDFSLTYIKTRRSKSITLSRKLKYIVSTDSQRCKKFKFLIKEKNNKRLPRYDASEKGIRYSKELKRQDI